MLRTQHIPLKQHPTPHHASAQHNLQPTTLSFHPTTTTTHPFTSKPYPHLTYYFPLQHPNATHQHPSTQYPKVAPNKTLHTHHGAAVRANWNTSYCCATEHTLRVQGVFIPGTQVAHARGEGRIVAEPLQPHWSWEKAWEVMEWHHFWRLWARGSGWQGPAGALLGPSLVPDGRGRQLTPASL